MGDTYYFKFTHEYEIGPSGPSRSYYDIFYGDPKKHNPGSRARRDVCLIHRDLSKHNDSQMQSICDGMNEARRLGQEDKRKEFREMLGVYQ